MSSLFVGHGAKTNRPGTVIPVYSPSAVPTDGRYRMTIQSNGLGLGLGVIQSNGLGLGLGVIISNEPFHDFRRFWRFLLDLRTEILARQVSE